MLSPEQAWSVIEAELRSLGNTDVGRPDALGGHLAKDLAATVNVPSDDVSAMDGYIAAGDIATDAAHEIVGVVPAGEPAKWHLEPGQVAKIMTGGVVPAGGDRVIPIEHTDGGAEHVVIHRAAVAGAHIRRRGEVIERGDTLFAAGHLMTPGTISALASHGIGRVAITRQPTVATLATGSEVVPPWSEPGPGQLRDSNSSFVLAACKMLGVWASILGIASDDVEELAHKIRSGMGADVLLLSGGVSKGDFDLVEDVLEELGCTLLFDAVAIQPGKPLVVARHQHGWVFGLPGNPASVMTAFWLFVRPLLRRLRGLDDGYWHGALDATLSEPLPATKDRDRFFAASVVADEGRLFATPHLAKGSHDTLAYAQGTALVRAPKLRPETEAGAACQILPFVDWQIAGPPSDSPL